jgi:autotransporter-associated beta strand protein
MLSFARIKRAAWLASTALASTVLASGLIVAAISPAMAQNATWLNAPGSANYNDGANWTPAGVPTGTASFGTSGVTALSLTSHTTVGGWTFNAGAPAYSFTADPYLNLNFTGAGIVTNGGSATIVSNGGNVNFSNTATADSAAIVSNGSNVNFSNTATAGSATIVVSNGGNVNFSNTATAGSATIVSNGGIVNFSNTATAGSANITANFFTVFTGTSTAGSATINANTVFFSDGTSASSATINAADTYFTNTATAANATLNGHAWFGNTATAGNATLNGRADFVDSSTAGHATINMTGDSYTFRSNSTAGSATIINTASNVDFHENSTAGNATVTLANSGAFRFRDNSTAGSATITTNNFGRVEFRNTSTAGSAAITNNNSSEVSFRNTSTAGNATITNNTSGTVSFFATSTAASATINNGGTLLFFATSTAGSATITNISTGTLNFYEGSTAGSATITTSGAVSFNDTSSGGSARLIAATGGSFDFSGLTSSGTTAGSIEGAGTFKLGSRTITVGGNNLSTTVSGVIQGNGGALVKTGTGTQTLSGTNTHTGATTVNAGTLQVDGSIASSSQTSVNNGATLSGNGIVGNTAINNGGTLAPGNSTAVLTVQGSLTFSTATAYLVQTSGASSSSRTVVTGAANYAGQVVVDVPTRLLQTNTYRIFTSGSSTGAFAGASLRPGNNFASNATLSYVGHDVFLTLGPGLLSLILPANAGANHKNVAGAVDNALLAGTSPSTAFASIFGLTGNNLTNGLTQMSGETATGSQQTTFNAMTQFMGLMTDPFAAGRADGANAPGFAEEEPATNAYAASGKSRSKNEREAYAAVYSKAPLARNYDPRWSVWAAGFGGSQTTDGNAALGSNTSTSRIFGMAAGADYIFSPRTIAGFALAGGGTSFSVANGGSGRSDLFQAGAFVRHTAGKAYITGALAYGWQDVTTDRIVTVAGVDRLRAQFNANAFSGRAEAGYRFVAPVMGGIGITPYAAGQFTTFDLPAYAEQVVSGANTFALAYGSKSVTATRSELGLRADKSFVMQTAILTLRGRAAWAHDFNPDRAVGATFQTLPGASFVVNGARQASDSALATASAEVKWMNGWSATGTFEGEFSGVTRSYAGKGVARYTW